MVEPVSSTEEEQRMRPGQSGGPQGPSRGLWATRVRTAVVAAGLSVLVLGCGSTAKPTRALATQYDGGNIVGRIAATGGRTVNGVVRIEELKLEAPVVGEQNEFRFPYMPPGFYRLTFLGALVGKSATGDADIEVRVGETSQAIIRLGSDGPVAPTRRR